MWFYVLLQRAGVSDEMEPLFVSDGTEFLVTIAYHLLQPLQIDHYRHLSTTRIQFNPSWVIRLETRASEIQWALFCLQGFTWSIATSTSWCAQCAHSMPYESCTLRGIEQHDFTTSWLIFFKKDGSPGLPLRVGHRFFCGGGSKILGGTAFAVHSSCDVEWCTLRLRWSEIPLSFPCIAILMLTCSAPTCVLGKLPRENSHIYQETIDNNIYIDYYILLSFYLRTDSIEVDSRMPICQMRAAKSILRSCR
jgi:hypothetical protein